MHYLYSANFGRDWIERTGMCEDSYLPNSDASEVTPVLELSEFRSVACVLSSAIIRLFNQGKLERLKVRGRGGAKSRTRRGMFSHDVRRLCLS